MEILRIYGKYIKEFNNIIDNENKTALIAVVPGHIGDICLKIVTSQGEKKINNADFSKDIVFEDYKVKAVEWGNSVLGEYGLFGDPNIVIMDDKYYIYPTTDGVNGWKSTHFKAFSSEDLVHWKDEGTILDLKDVKWSSGVYGWAPTAIKRGENYYFYYSSGNKENDFKDLAVAVSKSPNGPFKDIGHPLVKGGILPGQMIDSQVFIDDDSTPYLFWGNGRLYVAKLNEDMISFDGEIKDITPEKDFTEGIFVIKRNGKYYFTWSCGNTEYPDYHVRYGVADSPMERPKGNKVILSQEYTNDARIQCTAHHSIVNVPGTDRWFIAYHRFNIPTTVEVGGGLYAGSHREVAIDKLEFNENGEIKPVFATLEGITAPVYLK